MDPVYSAALAAARALSSLVNALGPQALPQMPTVVPALLKAALSAVEHLDKAGTEDNPAATYMGEGGKDEEQMVEPVSRKRAAEGTQALPRQAELVGALLGAVEAVVRALGPFLAVHLAPILRLVALSPSVLEARASYIGDRAAAIRSHIPEKIPVSGEMLGRQDLHSCCSRLWELEAII